MSHPPSSTPLVIAAAALIALGAAVLFERAAVAIPPVPSPKALEPQDQWRLSADPADVLEVPGYQVQYWGRPLDDLLPDGGRVSYGQTVTRHAEPFRCIVIHYTVNKPVLNFVKYQHNGDGRRGGSYGYHVYVGRGGGIWQGAPLSVRTNHVKDSDHRKRRRTGRWCNGTNALGISLVGACKVAGRSITDVRCIGWDATQAQTAAAMAAIEAVRRRYNISRCAVWGHGELQRDRRSYEGAELARRVRSGC